MYRGKRSDNKEWIEGYLFRISEKYRPFIMLPEKSGESYEIDPATLSRCSGCRDISGKLMYEKDIFESHIHGITMILKYGEYKVYCPVEDVFMINVGFYAEAEGYQPMPIGPTGDYAKVIGNIFDNPELLNLI